MNKQQEGVQWDRLIEIDEELVYAELERQLDELWEMSHEETVPGPTTETNWPGVVAYAEWCWADPEPVAAWTALIGDF